AVPCCCWCTSLLLHYLSCFFFFFSSRRRHTRSYGDWSSDVCSSDLRLRRSAPQRPGQIAEADQADRRAGEEEAAVVAREAVSLRSEERRVGKECRSRWGREQYKKKRERGEE